MPDTISLALVIHNHQPVGNFDFVFKENYNKAYLPFLEVLEQHPKIRISLHQSGSLLEWLLKYKPDYCYRIRKLVEKGQIEILGGGYYEPILPIIPDEDKKGQIRTYCKRLEDVFGVKPRGIWLAERVWEPHLPKPLNEAGVEYLLVDENHFTAAGLSQDELFGYYVTEEVGATIKVFPILDPLRHAIPFRPPEEVIEYLRIHAVSDSGRLAVFGDDGEKFGSWPDTYQTVYEEKWLEKFFSLIEANKQWLSLATLGEYIDKHPPIGRVYLPNASYTEMQEWALPVKAQQRYLLVLTIMKQHPHEPWTRFVRGGVWRNFLVKYSESNRLHKMMLRASKKVWQMKEGEAKNKALHDLWKGECNCPYWHGIFGGLYLPHLRCSVYEHLIRAEAQAEKDIHKGHPWTDADIFDYDGDGAEELFLSSDRFSIMLKPFIGGSMVEWNYRPAGINFLATMTRREEAYHQKVHALAACARSESAKGVSIHELSRLKDPDILEDLNYDWYEKVALIDHFLRQGTTIKDFGKGSYGEEGDFVNQPYQFELISKGLAHSRTARLWRDGHIWDKGRFLPLRIEKEITLSTSSDTIPILYRISHSNKGTLHVWFGVEWNLAFLTDRNPESNYKVGDHPPLLFSQQLASHEVNQVIISDALRKLRFSLTCSHAGTFWVLPLSVVSQSENGFEKVFEQLTILPSWHIVLFQGKAWELTIECSLKPFRVGGKESKSHDASKVQQKTC